jgi:hypothetical protein
MLDGGESTYMHTARAKSISQNNPLTLIFDFRKKRYIDYIAMVQGGANNYLQKTKKMPYSSNSENWLG